MPETSWLQEAVNRVRILAQEPAINDNYDDDEIVRHFLYPAASDVHNRLFMGRDSVHTLEFDVSFSSTTRYYRLPPNVRHINRIVRYDTHNQIIEEIEPRSDFGWGGPNWRINGDMLELRPNWIGAAQTWKIIYQPSGDVLFHEGNGSFGDDSAEVTFVLDDTPTLGRLDKRENGYAGSILRILDGTEYQERLITAYEPQTRTATVRTAFSPSLDSGSLQYEIAPPPATPLFYDAIALRAVLRVMSTKRANFTERRGFQTDYLSSLKALGDSLRTQQARRPQHFQRRTTDAKDFNGNFWGVWF